jgi:hypothetical protein
MTSILQFPTPRRSSGRIGQGDLFPAIVHPFPLTRYAGAVDRMACHLASLPTDQARSDAMVAYVEKEWQRLSDLGADEGAMEQAVIAFANAVWREVNSFSRGGVA